MKIFIKSTLFVGMLVFGGILQAATFVYFESDSESIGRGDTATVRPFDEIIARDNATLNVFFRATSAINPNSTVFYSVFLHAPTGKSLQPGIYTEAERFFSPVTPGLDANGYYGCNGGMGEFTVFEADFDQSIYAIDFEYICINGGVPQSGSFRGVIRINSDIPQVHNVLLAHAGSNQHRNEGDLVTLTGQSSTAGSNTIVSYQWNQISGTPVTLNESDLPSDIEFILPQVTNLKEDLVFELTVNNDIGQSDTQTVTVHATNQGGPKNYIRFYNADTLVKEYNLNDGLFHSSCISTSGLGGGSYAIGLQNCATADQLQFSFDGRASTRIDFAVQSPFIGFHEPGSGHCIIGETASLNVFSVIIHPTDRTSASVVAANILQNCTTSRLDDSAAYTKIEYRFNTLYPQPDSANTASPAGGGGGGISFYILLLLSIMIQVLRARKIKHR